MGEKGAIVDAFVDRTEELAALEEQFADHQAGAARLAKLVEEAKQRSDLLLFTGGLGPTADDLPKETVAAVFGW